MTDKRRLRKEDDRDATSDPHRARGDAGDRASLAQRVPAPLSSGRGEGAGGAPSPHFEISPREREDERRRDEYDFGVQEFADEEQLDRIRRSGDNANPEQQ